MAPLETALRKKIASLEKQRADMIADIDRKIALYRAALQSEESGEPVAAPQVVEPPAPPPKAAKATKPAKTAKAGADTDFVRTAIHQAAKGISAGAVRQAAIKAGLAVNGKFPYKALWRLKKAGGIRLKNGLYFPGKRASR